MCMRIELTVRRKSTYAVARPSSSMAVFVKFSKLLVGRKSDHMVYIDFGPTGFSIHDACTSINPQDFGFGA